MPIFFCCDHCGETLNENRGWICIWRKVHGKYVNTTFLHHGCKDEFVEKFAKMWLKRHINRDPSRIRWYSRNCPKRSFTLD